MNNFKILQYVLFFLIFTLLCVNSHLSAQDNKIKPTPVIQTQVDNSPISILLTPPPPGKLGISDMWKVTVINAGDQSYRLYFYGTLTENNAGLIAEASTIEVEIKKGTTIFKASDFPVEPEVNYVNQDPKYKNSLIQGGTVPPGDYTYCVYLIKKPEKIEYASQCLDVTIEDLNFLSLLTPGEEEAINEKAPVIFSWMSSKPGKDVTYKIKIVEVLANQSPESAFERNQAWFEKNELKTTTINYPSTAKPFEFGKKYAWAVVSGQTKSDIFTFTVGEQLANTSLVYEPVPGEPCCFRVKIITTEHINKLHFMGSNFLSVTPENNVSVTGQLFPNVFYLNSTPAGSEFISGSYLAKICLNATTGNYTISTYKSTNSGTTWNYLSLNQVSCATCSCPESAIPATATIGGQTFELLLNNLNLPPLSYSLPVTATFTIPEICQPSSCIQTSSWEMLYYGNSLSNTPVISSSTDRIWNYDFQNYGIYMLKYWSKCGGIVCIENIDTFRIGNPGCHCGKIISSNNTLAIVDGAGNLQPLPDNVSSSLSLSLSTPYQLVLPEYTCYPSNDCQAFYWLRITQLFGFYAAESFYERINSYSFPSYGSYKIEYIVYCGTEICQSAIDTIVLINSECDCLGPWEGLTGNKTFWVDFENNNGQHNNLKDYPCSPAKPLGPIRCSSDDYISQVHFKIGKYLCTPSTCTTKYSWKVTKGSLDGPVISESNGMLPFVSMVNIYFDAPSQESIGFQYYFAIYAYCDGIICDTCSFPFDVKCPDCSCGSWSDKQIKMINPDVPGPYNVIGTINCGQTKNVQIGSTFLLKPGGFMSCNPNNCIPNKFTYKAWINGNQIPDPALFPNGADFTTIPINSMPNAIWNFRVYAWCGNSICDSCDFALNGCDCGPPSGDCNRIRFSYNWILIDTSGFSIDKLIDSVYKPVFDINCGMAKIINYAPKSITISYNCQYSNPTCCNNVTCEYRYINGGGWSNWSQGSSFTLNPFNSNKPLIVQFRIKCGDLICKSCVARLIYKKGVLKEEIMDEKELMEIYRTD